MSTRNRKKAITTELKAILKESGAEYFDQAPFAVYQRLIAQSVALEDASLVLLALLNHAHKKAMEPESTEESIAEHLQQNCRLAADAATFLANVCLTVFNPQRQKSVREQSINQFDEFCSRVWQVDWEGQTEWGADGGCVTCYGSAKVQFKVKTQSKVRPIFDTLLHKNTQVTSQMMVECLREELVQSADREFDDYCLSDDYYPPVAEDFGENLEDVVDKWAEKYGLELVETSFTGETGDFEPSGRHGWHY